MSESGKEIYDALNSNIDFFGDIPVEEKKKVVQKIVDRIRDRKRKEIMSEG